RGAKRRLGIVWARLDPPCASQNLSALDRGVEMSLDAARTSAYATPADLYSEFVPSNDSPPILADAADVLSDQLRAHLVRLSTLIKPHSGYLDERFRQR